MKHRPWTGDLNQTAEVNGQCPVPSLGCSETHDMGKLVNMKPETPLGLQRPDVSQGTTDSEIPGHDLEGIEPTMDFKQIMAAYGWKYHRVYRYFLGHPRLGVQFTFNPGKRPKRFYDLPVSVVKAEWEMMHSVNKNKTDEWERRHPYQKAA